MGVRPLQLRGPDATRPAASGSPTDIAQRLRFPIEPEPYVAQLAAALGHDAYERLGAVSHPTLVVHGAEDRMVHPDNARLLAERIPAARSCSCGSRPATSLHRRAAASIPRSPRSSVRDLEICRTPWRVAR